MNELNEVSKAVGNNLKLDIILAFVAQKGFMLESSFKYWFKGQCLCIGTHKFVMNH